MRFSVTPLAFALFCLLGWTGAFAQDAPKAPDGPCKSARSAAQSFLDNLQPDNWAPHKSVRCFERPAGLSDAEMVQRVGQFKKVLDHRGLWVKVDALPDKADFKDAEGRHKVQLVDGLTEAYLVRVDGQWRFPAGVVKQIPALYNATFSGWIKAAIQALPSIFRARVFGYAFWQPVGLALLFVLCFFVSRLVRVIVRSRVTKLMERVGFDSVSAVIAHAARPLGTLAACGVFALALPELRLPISPARLLGIGARVIAAIAAVVLAYRLVDLVVARLALRAHESESRTDDQLVILLRKLMRVIVVAVGVVFTLQNLGIDVTSLIAGLGIGGLALALAAKDTAANLFGSITLLVDQPFLVGDAINAAGVEGTVLEIGLRSTKVRSWEDTEVTIPNAALAGSNIENFSRRTYRRYKVTLGLTYDSSPDQIRAFVEGVRAIIAAQPQTRKDAYEVHFTGYGAASLDILVQAHFLVASLSEMHIAKQQLLLEIMRLANEVGVEFAFPTQTIHMATQPGAAPSTAALQASVDAYGPEGARSHPAPTPLTVGYLPGHVKPTTP
ncbi:MAG: MscS family membrane protein [Bradymonadia bacterium]|jgi:MscS family membrane protein